MDLWEKMSSSNLTDDQAKELIKRRRSQMVIHSYLYYKADKPIISDDQWQSWAEELTKLQTNYPHCCNIKHYDAEFSDWDGTTGMHLPTHVYVERAAEQVYKAWEAHNA